MKKKTNKILSIFMVVLIAILSTIAVAAENVTITGTVNESYQIVDDSGTVYDVAESEKGNEVIELIGKKVQIIGTVVDDDGTRVVTVVSYTVVDE
jgi:hypothetical protein